MLKRLDRVHTRPGPAANSKISHGFVRAELLRASIGSAQLDFRPIREILLSCGIPIDVLKQNEQPIPSTAFSAALDRIATYAKSKHLPLHIGNRAQLDCLGLFGKLLRSTATLREALLTASTHLSYFQSDLQIDVVVNQRQTRIRLNQRTKEGSSSSSPTLLWLGLLMNLINRVSNGRTSIYLVSYPLTQGEHPRLSPRGTKILDSQVTSIVFDSGILNSAMPDHCSKTSRILTEYIFHVPKTRDLATPTSLTPIVEDIVSATIGIESITQPKTAALLDLSVRRLQRYLAAEGTSFRNILQRVTFDYAATALEEGNNVTDIALSLGYDHAQNFASAFGIRLGLSPTEFRRRINIGMS